MKTLLIIASLVAFAVSGALFAAGETAPTATDSNSKIRDLEAQEQKLALEMYKLRLEIIKKDPALLRLHKQIIAMHKELALKVDNKKEMRMLLNSYNEILRQLDDIKATTASGKNVAVPSTTP